MSASTQHSQTVMSPTRNGSFIGKCKKSRSPRRKPGSMLPESTTTMGDSVFVTTPKPFHIASAVEITVAKLSAVQTRQPRPLTSAVSRDEVDRTDLAGANASARVSSASTDKPRTTPSLRIVASSPANIVAGSARRRVARLGGRAGVAQRYSDGQAFDARREAERINSDASRAPRFELLRSACRLCARQQEL